MPSNPATKLSNILRSSSIEDHDEVLKAANAALKADNKDALAQHTRVVALLKLDRFDDALRAIDEGGAKVESRCGLEKAYAQYKLGKLEDATGLIKSLGQDERSLKHIAAQVAYRAERFEEAQALYVELLGSNVGAESNDIGINSTAAAAQSQWKSHNAKFPHKTSIPETFELCFNTACFHIATGSLDTALQLLQRAIRLCDGSDELTDADKETELRTILLQQAFVYAKLDQLEGAHNTLQKLDVTSEQDPEFTVVASNNLAAIDSTPAANPYIIQRDAQTRMAVAQDAKLFKHQSDILLRNNIIIDFKAQKVDGVKERTSRLSGGASHPTMAASINALSVIDAAATAHGKPSKAALRSVLDAQIKRPQDVGFLFAAIQMQILSGETGSALALMRSFLDGLDRNEQGNSQDVRFSPGIMALTVALLKAQGRQTTAKQELKKAANYWESRPASTALPLLREAGVELLRSTNLKDLSLAGLAFEKLLTEDEGSQAASAGLVASLAPTDPTKILEHASKLPTIDSLTRGVDVQSLISSGLANATSHTALSKKRPSQEDQPDRASRKRRKRKLPKNFVEGKTPDPERWLPLRDRSSYRPKGKKGKKKAADLTQGGPVKESETLDLVGGGGLKVEKSGGGGSAGAHKKKKKGKK